MRPPLKLSSLLILLLLLNACTQLEELSNIETVTFSSSLAVPVATMQVSLDDILENFQDDATLFVDPNGLFHFQYSGDVLSETGADLFRDIEDAFEQFSTLTPRGIPIVVSPFQIPFQIPGGVEIDKIRLDAGDLTYEFTSVSPEPVNVTIRFPQFFIDGAPLTFEHQLPAYSGNGAPPKIDITGNPFSMEGVEIIPENDQIVIEYAAVTVNSQQAVPLSPLNEVFVKIVDVDLTYTEGYLGTSVFDGTLDTIPIEFFDDWISGDVFFDDPRVSYILTNSFGIPTRSIVNEFNVITVEGNILPLESSLIEEGIDFPYPRLDEVGETKTATFVFTKDNSNIEDILSSRPVEVQYDVDALTHPDGNRNVRGFLTDSSFYKVGVEVDLPFRGRASDFVARDTFDLEIGDLSDFDSIEFKILSNNAIPIAIDAQVYFVDDDGLVLDSLLNQTNRIVEGAPVNAVGDVVGEVSQVVFADIAGERLDKISATTTIILSVAFSTSNNGNVSVNIYNDQFFDIKIGAIVKIVND